MPIQRINQEMVDLLRPFMSSSNPGAHAITHISDGSDEIDGDRLDIDWNPSYSTPAIVPAQVDSVDQLTAHLYGIDQAINSKSDSGHDHDADYAALTHASTHITSGSDEIDGDKLDIDWSPSYYTPDTAPAEANSVDNLTAHLYGIDQILGTIDLIDAIWVDPNGNADYTTITAAVAAASAGDTIIVGPGTYNEGAISINKQLYLLFLPGALVRYTGTDVYVLRLTGAGVGTVIRGADLDRSGVYASGNTYCLQVANLNAGTVRIEDSRLSCTPTNASAYDNAALNTLVDSGHTAIHEIHIINCQLLASGSGNNNIAVRGNNSDSNGNLTIYVYEGSCKGSGFAAYSIRALGYSVITSYWSHLTSPTSEAAGATLTIYNEDTFALVGHDHDADYAALTHASTHITNGSDEVDGDKLDLDWNPSYYTPATTPAEADNVDNLTAHLYGIDQALNGKATASHSHDAADIVSGTFADARIAESNITQHEGAIDHDALTNFAIGEHRIINDAGTSTTELWSANKINSAITSHSHPAAYETFRVHKNTVAQSIPSADWTLVTWSAEAFDTNDGFQDASDCYSPNTPGYWQFHAMVAFDALDSEEDIYLAIRKNLSQIVQYRKQVAKASNYSIDVSVIVYANGSSDYFDVIVYRDGAGSKNVSGIVTLSFFEGHLV